jgi:hypothetical protein
MSDKFAGGVKAGSTGVSIPVVLRRTADNTELTGKTAADVTATYRRAQSAAMSVTVTDLAAIDSAWSSGGWKEADSTNRPGEYRIDIPDAAFAAGADHVTIAVKVAGAYVYYQNLPLESKGAAEVCNLIGNTGSGLTSLAQASEWTSARAAKVDNLDAKISDVKAKTDNLPLNPAAVGSAMVLTSSGLDNITVETGVNARQALAVVTSACAGVLAGAATTSIAIAAANNPGTNRISATVDASGNRSAVTLNLPA